MCQLWPSTPLLSHIVKFPEHLPVGFYSHDIPSLKGSGRLEENALFILLNLQKGAFFDLQSMPQFNGYGYLALSFYLYIGQLNSSCTMRQSNLSLPKPSAYGTLQSATFLVELTGCPGLLVYWRSLPVNLRLRTLVGRVLGFHAKGTTRIFT